MIEPDGLRGRLIAAAPTPLDARGGLHREGLRRLVASMAGRPNGGVAVGTTIGRGSRLSPDLRTGLLSSWREGLPAGRLLLAAAGPSPGLRRPAEVSGSALAMALEAAAAGADLLLVEPPGALRGRPDRDRLVLEYHAEVARAGLPMLVSFRREVSGGIHHGPDVLAQLLARPEVLGVEVATFDGVATFQQIEGLARELAPSKLVVSGEERFLGYSLMSGADAAVVAMGAACPGPVLDLMEAHRSGDAPRFLARSREVDRLAREVFALPTDGFALRVLWALVQDGTLPFEAAHDPWGPRAGRSQFNRLGEALAGLDPGGPWIGARWPGGPA